MCRRGRAVAALCFYSAQLQLSILPCALLDHLLQLLGMKIATGKFGGEDRFVQLSASCVVRALSF